MIRKGAKEIMLSVLVAMMGFLTTQCTNDDGGADREPDVLFDENYFATSTDTAVTGKSSDITFCSAKLQGKINVKPQSYLGCVFGIVLSTDPDPNPKSDLVFPSKSTSQLFTIEATGLAMGTRYYYRAFFRYNSEIKVGRVMYFTTNQSDVRNEGVTDITPFSANVHAITGIKLNDSRFKGEYGILYTARQTDRPNAQVDVFAKGTVAAEDSIRFTVALDDLTPSTKYVFQPYIKIDTSYYYGTTSSFSTTALKVINDNKAVDMGIGTLWASRNVGATSAELAGTYFAWADPDGTNCSRDLNDYRSDKSEISGTEYDIATMNEGVGWEMPTYEQVRDLINNCRWNWTTYNGVQGYVVMSKVNGNTIFFPAVGYARPTGDGREIDGANVSQPVGFYWTGSLNNNFPDYAYSLYITKGTRDLNNMLHDRSYGYVVRAVLAQ